MCQQLTATGEAVSSCSSRAMLRQGRVVPSTCAPAAAQQAAAMCLCALAMHLVQQELFW